MQHQAQTITRNTGLSLAALVAMAGLPGTLSAAIVHTRIAAVGVTLPGGGTLDNFSSSPAVNASGQVAFAGLIGGSSATAGYFRGNGTSTASVARAGEGTPLGGTFGTGVQAPTIDDSGRVIFGLDVSGGSATGGVFSWPGGSTQALAARNGAAPSGGTYNSFSGYNAAGADRFTFSAVLAGSSASGVYRGQGSSVVERVAVTGDAAPGGGTYAGSAVSGINGAGHVAFNFASTGIFYDNGTVTDALARIGGATPLGGTFATLSGASISDGGVVAFGATITGGSAASGAFIHAGGVVQTLASVGQAAPGLAGLTFAAVGTPKLNANGLAVVRVQLAGAGVTTANDTALYISTSPGVLELWAREGGSVTVGGVSRTITGSISSNFFAPGAGGLAWRVQLDGTETLLYSTDPRFAVPGPGVGAVLVLGVGLASRRRR
jgi:hypothetical protein